MVEIKCQHRSAERVSGEDISSGRLAVDMVQHDARGIGKVERRSNLLWPKFQHYLNQIASFRCCARGFQQALDFRAPVHCCWMVIFLFAHEQATTLEADLETQPVSTFKMSCDTAV